MGSVTEAIITPRPQHVKTLRDNLKTTYCTLLSLLAEMSLHDDLMDASKAIEQCYQAIPSEVLDEGNISCLIPIERFVPVSTFGLPGAVHLALTLDKTSSQQPGCLQRHADRLASLERTLQTLSVAIGSQRSRFQVAGPRAQNSQRPAIHLPPELLSLIFEAACIEGSAVSRHTRHTISGVCFWWREVVCESPKLWSHISSEYRNGYLSRPARGLILLETERARRHPLWLQIDSISHQNKPFEPLFQQIALSGSDLWSLDIRFAASAIFHPIDDSLSRWRGRLSSLRRLILTFIRGDFDESNFDLDTPSLRFEQMPSLQHFAIEYHGGGVLMFEPSARSLTKLWIKGDVDAACSIHLINACPALASLVWIGRVGSSPNRDSLPALEPKPSLESLYISGDYLSNAISNISKPISLLSGADAHSLNQALHIFLPSKN